MKKLLQIAALLLLIYSYAFAKTSTEPLDSIEEIVSVFQSGSSKELAKFFDQGIDININGNQGDYSKSQAELVMRDFFRKFPPTGFQLIHKGSNSDQVINYIGNYESEEGIFRIFIRGKKYEGDIKVYSLDIVKGANKN